MPTIPVDLITDPIQLAAARRLVLNPNVPGTQSPAQLFSAPANMLLAPRNSVKKSYVLYRHIFGNGSSYPIDGYFYVGVTTHGL